MRGAFLPFLSKSFPALLTRFLGAVSGVLAVIFISRYFGAETLGIVSFAQRMYQLILILGVFGFREVIIKEFPQSNGTFKEDVLSSSMGISVLATLVFTILINFIPTQTINDLFEMDGVGTFIKIFSWGLIFHVASKVLSFALISLKKIQLSLLLDGALINIVLLILISIYLWLIGDLNYVHLGLIFLMSRIVNWVFSLVIASKRQINCWQLSFGKDLIGRSKAFFGISALYNLVQNVDLIVVAFILSPSDLGIYAAASRISVIIKLMTFVFNTGLMPELVTAQAKSKDLKNIQSIMLRNSKIGLMIGSTFMLVLFFFGKQILMLFGSGFDEGYSALLIISFCSVLQFIFSPFQVFLKMLGHEKKLLRTLLLGLVLLMVFMLIGTIQFGLLGASIALLMSFILLYSFELLIFLRVVKLNF